jgi:hypothetical protein
MSGKAQNSLHPSRIYLPRSFIFAMAAPFAAANKEAQNPMEI